MHDFMHDLAEEVTTNEIWRSTNSSGLVGKKVRHIHYERGETKRFSVPINIRSCIIYCSFKAVSDVSNCRRLRVLKVDDAFVEALPDTIGNLLHLRCLDLSKCQRLSSLPKSIIQSLNLQTLDLKNCHNLTYLPKDLSKLGKLQHLNIRGCRRLAHMPSRMDKLTCLATLTEFIVNEGDNSSDNRHVGELKDLQLLTELRGSITICVKRFISDSKEGGYLGNLKHIKAIHFNFEDKNEVRIGHEVLMEKLEPHSNLESISIKSYKGTNFPNWGKGVNDWATPLPGLVHIQLNDCNGMEKLPLLSRLRHLKTLSVCRSDNLEYMENSTTANASSLESIFFPSLAFLKIEYLNNLKGWWSNHNGQPCFPSLSKLVISSCPNLASFLCCPSLEYLQLCGCHQDLRLSLGHGGVDDDANNNTLQDFKLEKVVIDKWDYLQSMQKGGVTNIEVSGAEKMVSISEGAEVLKACCSLRNLGFFCCNKLKSISGGLEHLSLLDSLTVTYASRLRFDEEDEPWRSLGHSLRSLVLNNLPLPVSMPRGLQYLTNLQDLKISDCCSLNSVPEWIGGLSSLKSLNLSSCREIKSLPEAMSKLTSLHRLTIEYCSWELKRRCQQDPQGYDWPKIQHIPIISISACDLECECPF